MIERWYLSLCLLAFTTTGIVPILVPLEVERIEGNALHVGLVLSAIGAGMLTAPVWGALAQRSGKHRGLLTVGCCMVALTLLGFVQADQLWEWLLLSFGMGCGVSAVFTVANLLIVTLYPPEECNARVGYLQATVSGGTVAGLAAAGFVSHMPDEVGFTLGTGTALFAGAVAAFTVPRPAQGAVAPHAPQASVAHSPLGWHVFRSSWSTTLKKPIVTFSALWFFANIGVFGLNALYPLLMLDEFGVSASTSSFVLSAATALSTVVFIWSSRWTERVGPRRVLRHGLLARLVLLGLLFWLTVLAFSERPILGALTYALITLLWPPLSVSSTVLLARLAKGNAGGGMGLYNSTAALASLAGPVLAGQFAEWFTYDGVVAFAAIGVGLGLLLSYWLPSPDATEQTTANLRTRPQESQSTQSS
jgi:MFS family permease